MNLSQPEINRIIESLAQGGAALDRLASAIERIESLLGHQDFVKRMDQ